MQLASLSMGEGAHTWGGGSDSAGSVCLARRRTQGLRTHDCGRRQRAV